MCFGPCGTASCAAGDESLKAHFAAKLTFSKARLSRSLLRDDGAVSNGTGVDAGRTS